MSKRTGKKKPRFFAGIALAAGLAAALGGMVFGACSPNTFEVEALPGGTRQTMVPVIPPGPPVNVGTPPAQSAVFLPGRSVSLAPFEMGAYEVTYELWHKVRVWAEARGYRFTNKGWEGHVNTGGKPPSAQGKNLPVTGIGWRDAIVWCNAYTEFLTGSDAACVYTYKDLALLLTFDGASYHYEYSVVNPARPLKDSTAIELCNRAEQDRLKNGFRLPIETEWEFAARGANSSAPEWNYPYAGDAGPSADKAAWYRDNAFLRGQIDSPYGVQNAGEKTPNSLGLYDMSGNVWEWCWDAANTPTASTPVEGPSLSLEKATEQYASVHRPLPQPPLPYNTPPVPMLHPFPCTASSSDCACATGTCSCVGGVTCTSAAVVCPVAPVDVTVPDVRAEREKSVLRGGSWLNSEEMCKVFSREEGDFRRFDNSAGFRLARTL
jgi:formylglycine-generating enzyme required for sulfatase activity